MAALGTMRPPTPGTPPLVNPPWEMRPMLARLTLTRDMEVCRGRGRRRAAQEGGKMRSVY